MKRYITSSSTNFKDNESLADAFIAECEPYQFKLFKEYPNCYQIVGIPDPLTESIPELIRLVESVCEHFNIEFFDAHYGQGDEGDFIIFKIKKQ